MIGVAEELATTYHPDSAPDYVPGRQMRDLQLARLKSVVQRAWDNVALSRNRMEERGVTPEHIKSLDDIGRLPFTFKSDLRDTYPFGLFASPMREVVRLHVSSGTTGKPIVVAYTKQDLEVWTNVMLRTFAACGLTHGDILQNAYGYGLFTGGLGAHYGAEALGATVIPISGGNTDRQIMIMRDFNVTAICCTPSYFMHLIDRASELGVSIRDLPLRIGAFGAEPWSESMRRHIETEGGIHAFDIYGLSEMIGPGVAKRVPVPAACTCSRTTSIRRSSIRSPRSRCRTGGRRTGADHLEQEAMPMIRYRTRDITAFVAGTCGAAGPCEDRRIGGAATIC